MSAVRHEAVLRRLAAFGSLTGTECSDGLVRYVASLIEGGVLAWKKSGGGRRLIVSSTEGFSHFLTAKFPVLAGDAEWLDPRTQGVARFRDSKARRGTGCEILCLRALGAPQLWHAQDAVDVVAPTNEHGVFAIRLDDATPYRLTGCVALVENPTVFFAWERVSSAVHLALYSQGRFSRRLLRWLGAQEAKTFQLIHAPDYDPAGLADFLRLKAVLANRVSLHVPPDLRARFLRFSKHSLLKRKRSLDTLRNVRSSDHSQVHEVVALIDELNAGLEQEALLLDMP
jgi:hypothetical protein